MLYIFSVSASTSFRSEWIFIRPGQRADSGIGVSTPTRPLAESPLPHSGVPHSGQGTWSKQASIDVTPYLKHEVQGIYGGGRTLPIGSYQDSLDGIRSPYIQTGVKISWYTDKHHQPYNLSGDRYIAFSVFGLEYGVREAYPYREM